VVFLGTGGGNVDVYEIGGGGLGGGNGGVLQSSCLFRDFKDGRTLLKFRGGVLLLLGEMVPSRHNLCTLLSPSTLLIEV
jgi:hypothetical protein